MKNITEILNEAYSDDWMKAVSNKLNMIGADEFDVVCDIKKWAEATKDAIDDEIIL